MPTVQYVNLGATVYKNNKSPAMSRLLYYRREKLGTHRICTAALWSTYWMYNLIISLHITTERITSEHINNYHMTSERITSGHIMLP